MKSIFNRLLQRKEPEAVLAPKGNRVLSEKEVAVQQEKLQTQRAQESARQRAILTAQSKGPRNLPKSQIPAEDRVAKPSLWKRIASKRPKPDPQARAAKQKKNAIGPVIRDLLSGEFLTKEGVTRHIPYLLFMSGLFVAYIAMGYQFERVEREKRKTKEQIEELSAEFKTLQADFESRLQQSSVEKNIAALGLIQPVEAPFLLEQIQPEKP
jgi:hypothetical protein